MQEMTEPLEQQTTSVSAGSVAAWVWEFFAVDSPLP